MHSPSFVLLAALFAAFPAAAQNVSLQGMMGRKALLVIDGGRPRALAPGESAQGVKVISTGADQAVVLAGGKQLTLRVGATPVNVSGAGNSRIVLTADARGHFVTGGSINGKTVEFMVDTGATALAIGHAEADRIGLDYQSGRPVGLRTANGVVRGWQIHVDKVRVGNVTVHNVETVVTPIPMPFVLLGNSFLNHFSMRREGSQMTLEKRG